MLDLSKKKTNTTRKQGIRPGTYTARITDVCWTSGYVVGKAFTVKSVLISSNGTELTYEEIFYNSRKNARSAAFFDYLEDNGIGDLADFVGCTEEVVIAKNTDGFKTFNTIEKRTFVSSPDPEVSVE